MKYLTLLLLIGSGLYASNSTPLELAENLERGVQIIASGRIDDGIAELFAQGISGALSPKERAELGQNIKDQLKQAVDKYGTPRRVVRVSVVFFGDGGCRIRVLDRRKVGTMLWTFSGERSDDKWYMTGFKMAGDEGIIDVISMLDAADYSKEEPKAP